VASHSSIVLTMVTDSAAVQEVVLGNKGVAEGARPGSVLIDHSTISPSTSRAIAARGSQSPSRSSVPSARTPESRPDQVARSCVHELPGQAPSRDARQVIPPVGFIGATNAAAVRRPMSLRMPATRSS
jgi:hypothetical protein